jgi:hypothetical protein
MIQERMCGVRYWAWDSVIMTGNLCSRRGTHTLIRVPKLILRLMNHCGPCIASWILLPFHPALDIPHLVS